MTTLPILLPVGLLVAALIAALGELWRTGIARLVAITSVAVALTASVVGLVHVLREGPVSHHLGGWPPPIGIEYVLDPLSGAVAVLVLFIGLLVVVYPTMPGFYEESRPGIPLYALVLLLLTGLLGVVMTGDLFNLYVFLEVYAIATYALVALGGDRAAFASFRYLLLATIASGFYLLGVGFIYFTTGSLNMADVAARLPELGASPTIVAAVVLVVAGLAVKMALFPFHVWLPDAHSYAPPAVAALLAAIQVKVAAYAIIRITLTVFDPGFVADDLPVMAVLAWVGAAGIVFGSVMAFRQTDLKRVLAYSTVGQLGYIGLGIGLANPIALVGALVHVLNHAFVKSCLFFVAGGIIDRTGLQDVRRFGGLGRRMPLMMGGFAVAAASLIGIPPTAGFFSNGFAVAAASLIGIPPTAGFFSKWYLILGSLDSGDLALAVIIVGSSLLSLLYFLRVLERVFVSTEVEPVVEEATAPSFGVVAPVSVLAVGLLAVGIGNVALISSVLGPIASELLPGR